VPVYVLARDLIMEPRLRDEETKYDQKSFDGSSYYCNQAAKFRQEPQVWAAGIRRRVPCGLGAYAGRYAFC
jgi:hypothetical protein